MGFLLHRLGRKLSLSSGNLGSVFVPRFRHKVTKAQRHKGKEGQRHKETESPRDIGEWFFCFVPLVLCPFVPGFIKNWTFLPESWHNPGFQS